MMTTCLLRIANELNQAVTRLGEVDKRKRDRAQDVRGRPLSHGWGLGRESRWSVRLSLSLARLDELKERAQKAG